MEMIKKELEERLKAAQERLLKLCDELEETLNKMSDEPEYDVIEEIYEEEVFTEYRISHNISKLLLEDLHEILGWDKIKFSRDMKILLNGFEYDLYNVDLDRLLDIPKNDYEKFTAWMNDVMVRMLNKEILGRGYATNSTLVALKVLADLQNQLLPHHSLIIDVHTENYRIIINRVDVKLPAEYKSYLQMEVFLDNDSKDYDNETDRILRAPLDVAVSESLSEIINIDEKIQTIERIL